MAVDSLHRPQYAAADGWCSLNTLIDEMSLISQSMFGWLRVVLIAAGAMMAILAVVCLALSLDRRDSKY